MNHDLYKTGDADVPRQICDSHGAVVLALCRRCNGAEATLPTACPGVPLTPRQTDEVQAGRLDCVVTYGGAVTWKALGERMPCVVKQSGHIGRVKFVITEGHPWDGRPGFDLVELNSDLSPDNAEELAAFQQVVTSFERKWWKRWLIGTNEQGGYLGGVMYKPTGIDQDWQDSAERPHPGIF